MTAQVQKLRKSVTKPSSSTVYLVCTDIIYQYSTKKITHNNPVKWECQYKVIQRQLFSVMKTISVRNLHLWQVIWKSTCISLPTWNTLQHCNDMQNLLSRNKNFLQDPTGKSKFFITCTNDMFIFVTVIEFKFSVWLNTDRIFCSFGCYHQSWL